MYCSCGTCTLPYMRSMQSISNSMLGQDIGDGSRYGHHRAPIESGGQQATNRAMRFHTPDQGSVTVSPTRPEPPSTGDQRHARRAGAKPVEYSFARR